MDAASQDPIHAPIFKAFLAGVAAVSMDHIILIGQLAGAAYAVAVLGEWMWKRVVKPLMRKFGWIKRTPRGELFTDHGPLGDCCERES